MHGGQLNFEGLIQQVTKKHLVAENDKNLSFNLIGKTWSEVVNILGFYKSKIYYHNVERKAPNIDQVKCKKAGVLFQRHDEDIRSAQAKEIGLDTNIEAEPTTIQEALEIEEISKSLIWKEHHTNDIEDIMKNCKNNWGHHEINADTEG